MGKKQHHTMGMARRVKRVYDVDPTLLTSQLKTLYESHFGAGAAVAEVGDSFVVATSGGDGTSIDDAVGTAGVNYIWVKSGSYTETITADVANQRIYFASGVVITGAIDVTAANVSLTFGNGSSISDVIDVTGANCSIKAKNGVTFARGIDATTAADYLFVDGGGFGATCDADSSSVNAPIEWGGDYSLISNIRTDATSGSANNVNGFYALLGAKYSNAESIYIVDGDNNGFAIADGAITFTNSFVMGADSWGIRVSGAKNIVSANYVTAVNLDGISPASSGDNSLLSGNTINTTTNFSIDVDTNGNNVAVVGNRVEDAINDAATGTLVDANFTGTI